MQKSRVKKWLYFLPSFFPTCNLQYAFLLGENWGTRADKRAASLCNLHGITVAWQVWGKCSSSWFFFFSRLAASRLVFTAPRLSRSSLIQRKIKKNLCYSYFPSKELSTISSCITLKVRHSEAIFQISSERNCDSLIKMTHDALLVNVYVAHHTVVKIIEVQRERKLAQLA